MEKPHYDDHGNWTERTVNCGLNSDAPSEVRRRKLVSRLTSETNPESGTTTYSWDTALPLRQFLGLPWIHQTVRSCQYARQTNRGGH